MIRQELMKRSKPEPTAFRWRGGDVSRLEGFSDAVFGFAITLLVVSLEVPKTFDELFAAMRGFGGFAVCFCLLSLVWYDHYVFFRQYGLNDTLTVVLNLVLLFVVMFYVYPLKFLFTLLVSMFTGFRPVAENRLAIEGHQWSSLMLIYGAGFVAVYLVFTLMYLNAYRQRESLELNELELFDTRAVLGCWLVLISIGLTSIALALVDTPKFVLFSGLMYWLIGPAMAAYWTISGRRRRRLEVRYTAMIPEAAAS
jgi:uncharacterized membrane protein